MQFHQDFNVILLGTHSAITILWISQKTINVVLNFEQLMRAFFGLGDDVDFHCIDCHLVSGSYVNTQVSSQVIIKFNKCGSFSMRCKRSKQNSLRRSFVHLTAVLEPFLHKPFSCSIFPLEYVKHFPCPNLLPQLLLEHPTFGLFKSHLTLFQCCHW